jgi:hypothetical protein
MSEIDSSWYDAYEELARVLGIEEFDSTDEVVAAAQKPRTERDVATGAASMDVAAVTLADLRTENAKLTARLEVLERQAAYRAARGMDES